MGSCINEKIEKTTIKKHLLYWTLKRNWCVLPHQTNEKKIELKLSNLDKDYPTNIFCHNIIVIIHAWRVKIVVSNANENSQKRLGPLSTNDAVF